MDLDTPPGVAYQARVIEVVINGERRELPREMTVAELIEHLGLRGRLLAVELNGEVVPRAEHDRRRVRERDRIEIVHFVGGG